MWINHVPYRESEGTLRALYDRVKGPGDNVDNIMLAHSLRPHTMEGHMALYKATLHHTGNTIARWFLEALGVYTSLLNGCSYCVEHHFIGMKRQLKDEARSASIRIALDSQEPVSVFSAKEIAAIEYARMLTKMPDSLTQDDIEAMRDSGWPDEQILEINQVVAYFNYANRTVLGLGVHTDGDILGLSPNVAENPQDWRHRSVN